MYYLIGQCSIINILIIFNSVFETVSVFKIQEIFETVIANVNTAQYSQSQLQLTILYAENISKNFSGSITNVTSQFSIKF